jgi:hypothetical protein
MEPTVQVILIVPHMMATPVHQLMVSSFQGPAIRVGSDYNIYMTKLIVLSQERADGELQLTLGGRDRIQYIGAWHLDNRLILHQETRPRPIKSTPYSELYAAHTFVDQSV